MSSLPTTEEFIELSSKVRNLLIEERKRVDVGGYEAHGSLAKIKDSAKRIVVIGDIHGDYESLTKIISGTDLKEAIVVFLGDYVDRGSEAPRVVYEIFNIKLKSPHSVILLMGNHEGPQELPVYPHDFPWHLSRLYGTSWREIYESIMGCLRNLYACALLEGSLFMVHGGVPTQPVTIKSLVNAHQNMSLLEELLWNDPMTINGIGASPRGAGYLFGPDVTEKFLKSLGVRIVIRGHEPCDEGYMVLHNGRLITIFSRKGSPYFNKQAAYLDIRDPSNVEDAYQLAKECIRKI
ncbi:MAG: metallophosphoesterase family protein [Candidatus Nezhaarchaeales archaeon]